MSKNRRNARGNKSNPRGKEYRRDSNRDVRGEERLEKSNSPSSSPMNDISWYSKYPNLLVAAGQFPFPYRPGMNIDLGQYDSGSTQFNRVYRVPGVMALEWIPSIGISDDATSPASVLAKEFYAKVRARYSGSLSADAPDFVIYLLAMDSIYSYIAWLKRLYRVLSAWSPDNYVLPDRLLNAMGISNENIQTLRTQKTQLWQLINELVLQSRKFHVPAVMDIFNRHYWMSDNVYTDEATINSQMYLFNLKGVYQYTLDETNQVGKLSLINMPWVNESDSVVVPSMSATSLYQFGTSLINALVGWDDAYDISGYLMRAFEGIPVFQVDELPADQPFNPVYEPEVLQQIENSRAVPMGEYALVARLMDYDITQNPATNAILSHPTFSYFLGPNGLATITNLYHEEYGVVPPTLSIRSDSPSVADNVIASRLQATATFSSVKLPAVGSTSPTIDGWRVEIHCGTEIPLCWRVYDGYSEWLTPDSPALDHFGSYVFKQNINLNLGSSLTSTMSTYIFRSLLVEAFDWHPIGYWTAISGGAAQCTVVGDVHNLTTIDTTSLDNLHKVCIFSELNAFNII